MITWTFQKSNVFLFYSVFRLKLNSSQTQLNVGLAIFYLWRNFQVKKKILNLKKFSNSEICFIILWVGNCYHKIFCVNSLLQKKNWRDCTISLLWRFFKEASSSLKEKVFQEKLFRLNFLVTNVKNGKCFNSFLLCLILIFNKFKLALWERSNEMFGDKKKEIPYMLFLCSNVFQSFFVWCIPEGTEESLTILCW